MVIQRLADRHDVPMRDRLLSPTDGRPAAVSGDYRNGSETVRLVMPLTMMNESGEALRAIQADPTELLVVCDDVNLPLGTLRLRPSGGDGGHHGLRHCLEALHTEAIQRLRVGVGVAPLPIDLTEFVLTSFRAAERPVMKHAIEQAADACELWMREGIEAVMNRYNKAQVG